MKRKFTLLILAFTVLFLNVNAQFTTDGRYTIECVGTSKYMTNPASLSAGQIVRMTTTPDEFYIVSNGANFNIFTSDFEFLITSDGSKGILLDSTVANLNDPGALVDLLDTVPPAGANPYRIESNPPAGKRGWNGQRSTNTQVGMGTSDFNKYHWNLIRVAGMPVTGVTLDKTAISIGVGGTEQLTETVNPAEADDKTVTWSSSNSSIASVSTSGLVSAVAVGSATITVTTNSGSKTATCDVTVTNTVHVTDFSIEIPEGVTFEVEQGKSKPIPFTIEPQNATNKNVTWSSSNEAIATVNSSGIVWGVSLGTVTITGTTEDGSISDMITFDIIPAAPVVPVSPLAVAIAIMLIAGFVVLRYYRKLKLSQS